MRQLVVVAADNGTGVEIESKDRLNFSIELKAGDETVDGVEL